MRLKKNVAKKILTFIFILLVVLYFFQLYKVAKNYSQSYDFGDENAHMVGGYFILKGYTPYKDFSGNHQPLTYVFPSLVQKLAPANSLFLFIGRHRLAIYLYSIFWQITYLLIFGKFIFFFTVIFELIRYVLLGNKVLGEVWAMYPLVFLFGVVIKRAVFNKDLKSKEVLFFSLASFISIFSLLPTLPTVLILNLVLFIRHLKNKQKLLLQLIPFFIFTILLFFFIPFKYYFRDTIIDNITFVIPKMNKVSSNLDYIRMIFLPFSAFRENPDFINISMIVFLILYSLILYVLVKIKKIGSFLIVIFALVSLNSRNTFIKFGDFHVLPWLAVFFFIPIVFFSFLYQNRNYVNKFRLTCLISFSILLLLTFWSNFIHKADFYGKILFNLKNDLLDEHDINYSHSVKYGLAIKAMKNHGDRLFGIPNDTLAFWVAGVDLAVPPLESYYWQYDLPRYRKKLYDVFLNNPPEYFIVNPFVPLDINIPVGKFIITQLNEKYILLNHLGKPSDLFVLKSKINKLTDKQWSELKYYLFDKPTTLIN